MDYRHSEEFQNRTRKLHDIKQIGIDPYPHSYPVTEDSAQLHARYEQARIGSFEDAELGNSPCVHISGRLILFRSMGKNAFAHIQDRGGKIQILFNKDHTHVVGFNPNTAPEESASHIKFIEKKLDLGDILGIEGTCFIPKRES